MNLEAAALERIMRTITSTLVMVVGSTQFAGSAHGKCDPAAPVGGSLPGAEIVFSGRLVEMKPILVDREIVDDYVREGRESSGWYGEFRVEKVWKGSVGSAISVLAAPFCGMPFRVVGKSYVVAADRVGAYLVAHECQGIPPDNDRVAIDLLGPPKVQYSPEAMKDLSAAYGGNRDLSSPALLAAGFLAGTALASLIFARTVSHRRRGQRCLGSRVT